MQQYSLHERDDGSRSITGSFKGLKLAAGSSGVSIKGSLCKYYLQSNINSIGRQDAERAIEMMADDLGLAIQKATVSRADVAFNMLMNYQPKIYYPLLGRCSRYVRLEQPTSIYYNNSKRVKLFYDKLAELKKQQVPIPAILKGKNVMRYELRLTRNIAAQMQMPAITVATLTDEKFYMKVVQRWQKEYANIQKQQKQKIDFMNMQISTPKDFYEQMAWAMIQHLGEADTMQLIEDLKIAGKFEHKEYPSRLKKQIKDHLKKLNRHNTTNGLLAEMDKKIQRVGMYCR